MRGRLGAGGGVVRAGCGRRPQTQPGRASTVGEGGDFCGHRGAVVRVVGSDSGLGTTAGLSERVLVCGAGGTGGGKLLRAAQRRFSATSGMAADTPRVSGIA